MPYSAATVTFTDDAGTATVASQAPVPGDRFAGWVPDDADDDERAVGLGTARTHAYVFRTVDRVRFTVEDIPAADFALALRLARHLRRGGTCSVATGDAAGHSYPTCGLAPGATPDLQPADRVEVTYRLTLDLVNLAVPSVPFLCDYAA